MHKRKSSDRHVAASPGSLEAAVRPTAGIARGDLVVATILGLICLLAWCAANAKWTPRAWALPATYVHDPERGDFFSNAAFIKASSDWSGLPFRWKTVRGLGAPHDGNWNDFPTLDETVLVFQGLLARLLGLFAGMNASFALAHMLASVAMFAAARLSGANMTWSALAGLAFGVAPFIFAQSPHHFQVAYVWPIAFFPLVWRAVSTSPGLTWRSRPFWIAVGFGLVTGLHFVYYTNVFCQLVLLGAVIQWCRTRDATAFRAALAVIGAAALGFALNNADEWTYRLFHEPNTGAFVREYKWLEIYGFKLVDLIIPPVTHRLGPFAAFAAEHRKGAPLLDEGASYLGIVGLLAFAWVIVDAVRAGLRGRFEEVPIEAWWILWIVLMFTTGGLNAIFGAAGITMFRAACRYAVVVLAISLLYAAKRLTMIQVSAASRSTDGTQGILWGTVATALGLTILFDQVPRAPSKQYTDTIAALVESDRRFVADVEAALPDGAMVLQLPVMEYPESPIAGLGSYEHFRPFLYSTRLRFSFGTQKGRDREAWLKKLVDIEQNRGRYPLDQWLQEIAKVVREADERGFAAVYINRRGYEFPPELKQLEFVRKIEDMIREMGHTRPLIRSPAGDLDCIPLKRAEKQ